MSRLALRKELARKLRRAAERNNAHEWDKLEQQAERLGFITPEQSRKLGAARMYFRNAIIDHVCPVVPCALGAEPKRDPLPDA